MAYPDFNADKPSAKKKGKKSHEKNRKPSGPISPLCAPQSHERDGISRQRLPDARVITGFDSFVVILESDGKQQMLYKHAISTIVPIAAIDLKGAEESEE